MVHTYVRRRVRTVFAALERNDFDAVLAGVAPDVVHVFSGDNAISGERRGKEALTRWFARLGRLFPRHDFTLHRIVVDGPPWDLVAAVRWSVSITPAAGPAYDNAGSHWLRIQRGRVTEIRGYTDSAPADTALAAMADAGIDEAAAPPLS